MAPKQLKKIENPVVSSSEEEESASSGESATSGEESDSSADSPVKESTKKPVVVNKPSGSKTTTKPESSTAAKRSFEKTDEMSKKKSKNEDVKKKDETPKKNLFVRLFTEEDEAILLQGFLDFATKKGNPSDHIDDFYESIKNSISFDVTKPQLVTKIGNLKKKFNGRVSKGLKKGKNEEVMVFSKASDQNCFDLSRKIWGSNGVLYSKSKNMRQVQLGGSVKVDEDDQEPQKHRFVISTLSSGQELVSYLKVENPNSLGVDDTKWSAKLDKIKDGKQKRKMEKTLKKIQAKEEELSMMRSEFVAAVTNVLSKQDNASSSCK
ncbi:putative transcription factor [Arabidopsis thaliana]